MKSVFLIIGVLAAIGLGIVSYALATIDHEYEFVSSDGGFVMKSGFKTPIQDVEENFGRYRFLRGDPKMFLLRTTQLAPFEVFSKAAKYSYKPAQKKAPVDWYKQLETKCLNEYIPTLPVVLEQRGIKLFFFNQYEETDLKIHGMLDGQIFALTIRNDPRMTASGEKWESPVWAFLPGDVQNPYWRSVWQFVKANQAELIETWDQNRKDYSVKFDPHYDFLFD